MSYLLNLCVRFFYPLIVFPPVSAFDDDHDNNNNNNKIGEGCKFHFVCPAIHFLYACVPNLRDCVRSWSEPIHASCPVRTGGRTAELMGCGLSRPADRRPVSIYSPPYISWRSTVTTVRLVRKFLIMCMYSETGGIEIKVLIICCMKCDRIVLMKSTNLLSNLVLHCLALMLRMRKVPGSDLPSSSPVMLHVMRGKF